MKILVFEYVTGGGFGLDRIPDSLATEGLLMLRALLRDLSEIADAELTVMLDARFADAIAEYAGSIEIVMIDHSRAFTETLEALASCCDAVWPVAPEMDGILFNLTYKVEQLGKKVLSSSSSAVALTSNKFETFRHLMTHAIDTAATQPFVRHLFQPTGRQVIKPVDGMGCERTFRVDTHDAWNQVEPQLGPKDYILQPYLDGIPASLSCLFSNGRGWLLCHNVQQIEIKDCRFRLAACRVNDSGINQKHRALIDRIAETIPGLWGYVGIDIIETAESLKVLEINPRLTTSYAGIREALGINVAAEVLRMSSSGPNLNPVINRSINLFIEGDETYAT